MQGSRFPPLSSAYRNDIFPTDISACILFGNALFARTGCSSEPITGGLAMVIECSCCRARYRMKESMMRGFPGAEVRCRKCGETIVVRTPGTSLRRSKTADREDRTGGHRWPSPPKEKNGPAVGREDPRPEHAGHGLPSAEAKKQAGKALAEESDPALPVPDNVYSLNLFRESRPKRLPTGGYDISGWIRPKPVVPPSERKRLEEPSPPLTELPGKWGMIPSSIHEDPIKWDQEDIPPLSTEALLARPKETPVRRNSPHGKSRSRSRLSTSVYPRPLHIAIVYLLLLLLGGCGYLLVRLLFQIMGNEGNG